MGVNNILGMEMQNFHGFLPKNSMFIIYKWTMDSMAMLSIYICLVVWNHGILNFPQCRWDDFLQSDELIYFSEGLGRYTTNQKQFSPKKQPCSHENPYEFPLFLVDFPIFRPGEFQQPGLVVQLGKFCHFMPGRTRCAMGNSPWSARVGETWEYHGKSMGNLCLCLFSGGNGGYRWIYI